MPFQASESLDDQLLIDGTSGFSTGVISATRPDAIPATSMESAINMDYDDFGNVVSRLGTVSLTGNPVSGTWENIIENWESITSSYGSNLPINATVFSGFYFDTAASERMVIAVNDTSTKSLYYGSPTTVYSQIAGSTLSSSATYVYFAQLNDKLFYSDGIGSLKYITYTNTNQYFDSYNNTNTNNYKYTFLS